MTGGYFVAHGTQKLFGWFNGHGIEATAGMFGQLGLRPPKAHAFAAGAAETGGGLGLLLGAATPLASSAIIATMLTAIRTVHWRNGPFNQDQGYEYNLVLIAAAVALAETGPGSPSIDAARGSKMHGPGWAVLALLLGALGAAGAQASSKLVDEPAATEASPAGDASPADAAATA